MLHATVMAVVLVSQPPGAAWSTVVDLPSEQRVRFRNPDGSCVQCSIGMCGVAQAVPSAEFLLWESPYGPAVRGGSHPERVKRYCDARQIQAWNVYGQESFRWIEWCVRNGRPCAVTLTPAHMQTVVGYAEDAAGLISHLAVCDNNSPQKIDWWTREQFVRAHTSYGGSGWVVILITPPCAGSAQYWEWWQL